MKKKLQKENLPVIFRRYCTGESMTSIGHDFDVSQSTISTALKYYSMEAAVDFVKSGKSIAELSTSYNLTENEMRYLINKGKSRFGPGCF